MKWKRWIVKIEQYQIWIADLNPRVGTESGKIRPVVIVQSDLLNTEHPSIIVCPVTSKIQFRSKILRVHLQKGIAGLLENSDIMIDQIRSIDNKRLIECTGVIPDEYHKLIKTNLSLVLDL